MFLYKKLFYFVLIFATLLVWVFGGHPRIWQNPAFPPEIRMIAAQSPETFNSSSTWTAPEDVCEVTAEAWGGGAGGFTHTGNNAAGGGGGGAYTKGVVSVTPGNSNYTITVGAQVSASTNGNGSSFTGDDSLTVTANAGQTGTDTAGGAGGAAQAVSGHIQASFAGGTGGSPHGAGSPSNRGGGGGGGSATASANGGNGGGGTGSAGGSGGTGQATGGTGGRGSTNGGAGGAPGAGGGGSGSSSSGGTGAAGRVVLTYAADPGCASGSLTVDIVDGSGNSVASPSVTFSSLTYSFNPATSTATFGTSSEKIRVTNTTATASWTLTTAATSTTAVWYGGTAGTYDYNDSAWSEDGGDADSVGGRLHLDPSVGTITPQSGCSSTGLSKGSAAAFVEGSVDSITLLSASGSAETNCYWDFTGITMTQSIPAGQNTGTYNFQLVLTAN